jgi:hypothetical protein
VGQVDRIEREFVAGEQPACVAAQTGFLSSAAWRGHLNP